MESVIYWRKFPNMTKNCAMFKSIFIAKKKSENPYISKYIWKQLTWSVVDKLFFINTFRGY